MRLVRYVPVALGASAALVAALVSPSASATTGVEGVPGLGHVFVIIGENTQLSQINAGNAPWMTAALGGTAGASSDSTQNWAALTNYFATTHYSESNYVAMMAGQFNACQQKDGTAASCHWNVDNLFHQLYNVQKTFTTWSESMPNACHLLNSGGDSPSNHYAAKHNPQLFFDNVEGNQVTPGPPFLTSDWVDNGNTQGGTFCQGTNIATGPNTTPDDMSGFNAALNSNAAFSDLNLVVPNECEDAHDNCKPAGNPITQFDNFLAREVPLIQGYIARNGGTLFVTFDEGVTSSPKRAVKFGDGGNVAFLAWGAQVHPGVYTAQHTAYAFLRTLEDGFAVSGYVGNAANVTPIAEIWNN